MKKFIIMLLLMFALAMPISADMTWSIAGVPTSDWWQGDTGSGKDIALLWAREVEEMLNGGTAGFASIYFEPGTEPDPNNEGDLYYSAVLDALVLRTVSGWETLTGTIATVEAYIGAGNTITIAESGSVFTNEGDGDGVLHTLPEASTAIGCSYTFVVIENQDLIIELDNADIFMHLTCNAGDQIQSSEPNDTITVMAVSDSEWAIISVYPTAADWADGGA